MKKTKRSDSDRTDPDPTGQPAQETVSRDEPAGDPRQAEMEALKDRYLRLAAEFDNYRKRTQREKEELLRYGTEQILRQLLPFDEVFAQAVDALEQGRPKDDPIRTGLEMLKEEFSRLLSSIGLVRIETSGRQFDPSLHEAVATRETADVPEGAILEEHRPGYLFHDRVLRPAAVVVARAPSEHHEDTPQGAGEGQPSA